MNNAYDILCGFMHVYIALSLGTSESLAGGMDVCCGIGKILLGPHLCIMGEIHRCVNLIEPANMGGWVHNILDGVQLMFVFEPLLVTEIM